MLHGRTEAEKNSNWQNKAMKGCVRNVSNDIVDHQGKRNMSIKPFVGIKLSIAFKIHYLFYTPNGKHFICNAVHGHTSYTVVIFSKRFIATVL